MWKTTALQTTENMNLFNMKVKRAYACIPKKKFSLFVIKQNCAIFNTRSGYRCFASCRQNMQNARACTRLEIKTRRWDGGRRNNIKCTSEQLGFSRSTKQLGNIPMIVAFCYRLSHFKYRRVNWTVWTRKNDTRLWNVKKNSRLKKQNRFTTSTWRKKNSKIIHHFKVINTRRSLKRNIPGTTVNQPWENGTIGKQATGNMACVRRPQRTLHDTAQNMRIQHVCNIYLMPHLWP